MLQPDTYITNFSCSLSVVSMFISCESVSAGQGLIEVRVNIRESHALSVTLVGKEFKSKICNGKN